MSQIYKSGIAGPVPPTVPTSFTTDSGVAVPAANNLNVFGIDSVVSNDNGIMTTGSGSTLNVVLTNRTTGSATTADATPTTIITFAMGATPGVFQFEVRIAAFDATDIAGGGYVILATARTTGAAATVFTPIEFTVSEEAAMNASDVDMLASGNNVTVVVTGIAAKTIRWNATLTFVEVT